MTAPAATDRGEYTGIDLAPLLAAGVQRWEAEAADQIAFECDAYGYGASVLDAAAWDRAARPASFRVTEWGPSRHYATIPGTPAWDDALAYVGKLSEFTDTGARIYAAVLYFLTASARVDEQGRILKGKNARHEGIDDMAANGVGGAAEHAWTWLREIPEAVTTGAAA